MTKTSRFMEPEYSYRGSQNLAIEPNPEPV
jgi:hypothetical protein